MPNGDDPSVIHTVHTWWNVVLSGFGALLFWNWKEMAKDVKGKADKEDLREILTAIQTLTARVDRLFEHRHD